MGFYSKKQVVDDETKKGAGGKELRGMGRYAREDLLKKATKRGGKPQDLGDDFSVSAKPEGGFDVSKRK